MILYYKITSDFLLAHINEHLRYYDVLMRNYFLFGSHSSKRLCSIFFHQPT